MPWVPIVDRGERNVDGTIGQQESCPLQNVLRGNEAAHTVVSGSRDSRCDGNGPPELFLAGSYIQRVQSVEVRSVLESGGNDVQGRSRRIDDRSAKYAHFRC